MAGNLQTTGTRLENSGSGGSELVVLVWQGAGREMSILKPKLNGRLGKTA